MPIYEYQCQACGHEEEILQKFSDAPVTECPACRQPELKKKVSAAGFRLSGGGWYETDFKSGNKKNLAGDNAKDSAKNDGGDKKASGDAKSDTSKSAAKSSDKPAAKAAKD